MRPYQPLAHRSNFISGLLLPLVILESTFSYETRETRRYQAAVK